MGLYSSILETISFNRNCKNPIFGGMQFWGFWFSIVTPYMIYYIHIIIDYIDSSIHLITLPEYRKVILWYINGITLSIKTELWQFYLPPDNMRRWGKYLYKTICKWYVRSLVNFLSDFPFLVALAWFLYNNMTIIKRRIIYSTNEC